VACAGVSIQPGDIIAGDGDGVIVVPRDIAYEVARDAREQERQEEFIAEMVARGESVDGLYPISARWRPAYEAWLTEAQLKERGDSS
jgi:regulator of RNase E activity RraA